MCVEGGATVCDTSLKRNFHKDDHMRVSQMFSTIQWEEELSGKNVEEAWATFLGHQNQVLQQCPLLPRKLRRTATEAQMDDKECHAGHYEERGSLGEIQKIQRELCLVLQD